MLDKINVVSVSGGKDSTATLLLAKERVEDHSKLRAVFCDTGHENKLTIDYVEYLSKEVFPIKTIKADFSEQIATRIKNLEPGGFSRKRWIREGISEERVNEVVANLTAHKVGVNPFLDLAIWRGRFPSTKARFCTQELKIIIMEQQVYKPLLEEYEEVVSWIGERAEESVKRAGKPELEEILDRPGLDGLWLHRPILQWKWQEVFDFHSKHGVDPNPLYKMGMGRVGCFPCIMATKDELAAMFKRFPDSLEYLDQMEAAVRATSKRAEATIFDPGRVPGKGINSIHDIERWSRTAHGGKQFSLKSTTPPKKCDSIYALCE